MRVKALMGRDYEELELLSLLIYRRRDDGLLTLRGEISLSVSVLKTADPCRNVISEARS